MSGNPFADPNAVWRAGVRVKDIKIQQPKRAPPAPAPASVNPASGAFRLENLVDCYQISGVPYRGESGMYEVSKTVLPATDFAGCVAHSQQARMRGDYEVPSAPLLHGIVKTLYAHREDAASHARIEGVRTFLKDVFERTWVWTLSKAVYAPKGQDRAIHEVGLPTEFGEDEALVGPEEWAKDASAPGAYAALWHDTPTNIQDVYRWLTGKDAYLWRLNEKPEKQAVQCGVACGVGGGGFSLDARNGLGNVWPAFGVRRAKNFP